MSHKLAVFLISAGLLVSTTAAGAAEFTLYTSMPKKAALQTIKAYEKTVPGLKIKLFRSGSGNVLSKLRAEVSAGGVQADLVMIADEISMESLKRGGQLMAYKDAPVTGLPAGSYDRDMTYFGTKIMSTVILYNVKNAKRPRSWSDLLGAENKGQVLMANAVTSGSALANLSFLTGSSGLGWGFYKKLAANGALVVRSNGQVRDTVASGARKYGMVLDYVAVKAKKKGSPVDYVYPNEGVVATYQPIALMKGSKNVAAAKKFIAFLLSKAGQKLVAKQGYRPLRAEIKPPKGFPSTAKVKIVPVDASAAVTGATATRKRFNDLFAR